MATHNANAMSLPLFGEPHELTTGQHQEHDPQFDLNLLALSQVRGLGLSSIQALIDHLPTLGAVWQEQPGVIRDILHDARVPASNALADEIHDSRLKLLAEGRTHWEYLHKRNIHVLADTHPDFPRRLRDMQDAPRWLFVEGDASILNAGIFVAVVGTRSASNLGVKTAEQVTYLAANAGIGLVSGLAEGIDAAAHATAARYHEPQVAVLGTGINITFPTSTATTRRNIVDTGGCVVTEYLPNDNYGKSRFVQRNRIQAGLSEAVCAIEGKSASGTMHTVRFAGKYERRLFGAIRGTASTENEMPEILAKMGSPDTSPSSGGTWWGGPVADFSPRRRAPAPALDQPSAASSSTMKSGSCLHSPSRCRRGR